MSDQPPFRADIVGSFLRPEALKQARIQYQQGEINAVELKAVEDREIQQLVTQQEALGLRTVTDGEFRRAWWHFDFLEHLNGVTGYQGEQGIQFQGVQTRAKQVRIDGPISFNPEHPMLDHFRFLNSIATVTPKMTIPSPSVLHFRNAGRIDHSRYAQRETFFADLADAYRDAVHAFYQAGCRYLQLDDTVWAYLCSEKELAAAQARGLDTSNLQSIYADMINHALADKPEDLYVGLHVCRGNFRSTWISEGGYEPVAETLFGQVGVDAWFLEYDSERAGGFEPLRFIPEGHQQAVLGLITTKVGTLEDPDAVRARLEEATRWVAKSQLCLSPQCGFASTEEGNHLAEQAQWDKLRLTLEIANQFWGES
ncbi:5-methyltetrahydropteroyltriglutamate--homocysteine S-methyltransferase [Terasakiispira papahanaumokuakeensis]|uniref:5-methyltetrahydropteroyltriglutamate--homocysteine S-methyltransferase n=1 Tax=Terasakiispira papahanaumokuakeensis TaxID=197479 RepID=A0A1E2V5M0_9GAMM|nr:5-methyltetrahydropteroyltriglutamate--homocysteine S-methyltransferase [Terasakiispira papahanaumokuakeensis]ODC02277.1 5-methyltetrahydropteroyltriglutamate--homocysteine S-methyltransferase [Terasakiispira papahanaumokuakeensis]